MDTSLKLNDFATTMQTQVSTAKLSGSDYKNEAFYSFMQQTTEAQKTSNNSTKKDTTSKKEATKESNNSVDEKEDVAKSETQPKETTDSKDTEEVKDNMMQQVDLAMFAAAVNANIVPAQSAVSEQTVETPVVEVAAVEVQTNETAQTTQQAATTVDTMQKETEEVIQQFSKEVSQTEQTVSEEAPKEVEVEKAVEVQPKQQQTEKAEVVKTETKTENVKTAEETVVVEKTTETETKSDTTQTNTSEKEETDLFEEDMPVTNKRTFSDDVINIKVGDNAQITDSSMAQKVSDKMLAKFAQKQNEFEIQLMPKELGKIVIKLVVQNGQTHISMFAENAKTSSLLAEKAREISSIIEQNTGNETNVEVVDQKEMHSQDQNREAKGDGFERQKEEQQKQHQQKMQAQHSADFIQQMRLGLWNRVS